jgi:DNA-binding MltR family transcriptional regulator
MEKFNKDCGHAILAAAQLDDLLQRLLLTTMPRISNVLAKNLFDRGPLGTFSAKIDLARALGLIDVETRSDLRTIKAIRNAFAHTQSVVHFRSEHIVNDAKKFKHWRESASARKLFDEAVGRCEVAINAKMSALVYEHATGE